MLKMYKWVCKIIKTINQNNVTLYASSWAFFLLFTIVPLFFIIITLFNFFGFDVRYLLIELPPEIGDSIVMMFDIANNSNRNITFFFVITSLYSATKLFYILLKDGELIYLEKRNSSSLWHKMWSFIVLFVILCFVALVTVIFILNKSIIFILPLGIKLYALMYKIIYNSLAILIVYGIIITINRFICPIKKSLLEILVGSFVTLIISVMGSIGFVLYLHYFVSYDNLYGSLASIIIFMLWAYILTFGLSLGNVVTKILIENRRFYEQYFRNKKLYKNLRRY